MNVHIVGLAGSGKTTLACWLAEHLGLDRHDLDSVVYDNDGERPLAGIEARIEEILRRGTWVTEGAYGEPWLQPLLAGADTIVWLDVGLATCLMRMVKRHVTAELRRSNEHPGWLRLVRFMNYTRRSAMSQRKRTAQLLSPYGPKVHRCRKTRDVAALKAAMLDRAGYGTTTNSSPS